MKAWNAGLAHITVCLFKDVESGAYQVLCDQEFECTKSILGGILGEVERIGFDSTAAKCRRILEQHFADSYSTAFNNEQFVREFKDLRERYEDELEKHVFFVLEQQRATQVDKWFTDEVKARFDRARFDMREAAICFQFHRYTACVFHLMRVLSCGIKQLGQKCDVAIDGRPEDRVIRFLKDKLGKGDLPEMAKLKDLVERLDNSLEAIRHPLSHSDEGVETELHLRLDQKYTEEEADRVHKNVKAAMEAILRFL